MSSLACLSYSGHLCCAPTLAYLCHWLPWTPECKTGAFSNSIVWIQEPLQHYLSTLTGTQLHLKIWGILKDSLFWEKKKCVNYSDFDIEKLIYSLEVACLELEAPEKAENSGTFRPWKSVTKSLEIWEPNSRVPDVSSSKQIPCTHTGTWSLKECSV